MMAENKEQNIYRLAEISKHCHKNSLWIVIHNKVYDVTKFLDDHPGGDAVLLENAGKDATYIFEDVGHSSEARLLAKDYLIGSLHEDERTAVESKKSNCSLS